MATITPIKSIFLELNGPETFFAKTCETFVTKFVDLSSKFGVGYKLKNGNYGVYFNDHTNLISDSYKCVFIDKETLKFNLNKVPEHLYDKIELLNHF